ncbi:hypothetical protein KIN20_036760 [Parelaphostrongylus tenuis]|uniref:SWI/SNF-related matrix-associated actin-dependent regulator of chromatin subfamily A containing DEAD/H box 1 homolog n=1 Tax=Parelaphostrongylus tenuis TaxID=148309 RepID=A0AAD5RDA1_PARTN|nr:hypothetical protein KIN20_036760 [Parelaphostrongylus tenuis]
MFNGRTHGRRIAHTSTPASDEMMESLQHKRLSLAKAAASIKTKKARVPSQNCLITQFVSTSAKAKRRNRGGKGDDSFVSDEELHDADEDISPTYEERSPRKKRRETRSSGTVCVSSPNAALGLGHSRTQEKKTRTLSESSGEEWLCKPRLKGIPERNANSSLDTPIKKHNRRELIVSDDSESENEEKRNSLSLSTKAAKEGTKCGRKRKLLSPDEDCVDGGNGKDSEPDEESYPSDGSEDGDELYTHNEVMDNVMRDCLDFFNTASRSQLLSTPRVTDRIATKVITERPFDTFAHLESAIAEIPRGIGALNSYMEFLKNRGILEKILDDCKDHSLAVAAEFEQRTNHISRPKLLESGCKLHEYQTTGLNWLVLMHEKGFNCILGDEMGLGKTIQVIAFLAYLKEAKVRGPHLIVVPSSTIENWIAELTKWCPKVNVLTYYGAQEERRKLRHMAKKRKEDVDVILTTYNMISSKHDDKKFFKNFSLNYVIYDEGHMLKNCSTDRYRNLMKVKGKRKILMTGTPLQNNLIELISLIYFVMTDIFTKYCEDIAQLLQHFKQQGPALESASSDMYQKDRIEQAKLILQPYMLRRLKLQVLGHLPEKHDDVIEVEMSECQKELYETVLDSVRGIDGDGNNAYGALMYLRQVANHPLLKRVHYTDSVVDTVAKTLCSKEKAYEKKRWEYVAEELAFQSDFQLHKLCEKFGSTKKYMLNEDLALDSGKCRMLDELLPKIKERGDKVLVFSQFTSMLDILEVYLRIRKYAFRRLDGSTPVMERQEIINEFNNEPELFVFLLSTRAGGLGINLTSANHIILHDIDFNPYNDKQAEDRCHRMGQEKSVFVTRLVSKDTVEEDIYRLARKKLQLEKAVTAGVEEGHIEEIDEISCGSAREEKPDSDTLNLLLNNALKRKYKKGSA